MNHLAGELSTPPPSGIRPADHESPNSDTEVASEPLWSAVIKDSNPPVFQCVPPGAACAYRLAAGNNAAGNNAAGNNAAGNNAAGNNAAGNRCVRGHAD
jgi:hypothetical protein